MANPFQQFEIERNKPLRERLNRITNVISNPYDSPYFSWEMNLNLAQFNAALVIIYANMLLKHQSVKDIYNYLISDDYTSSALNSLRAGHSSDEAMKKVAANFTQTREILRSNGGKVTDDLKKKLISIASVNFLLEAVNLIYQLANFTRLKKTYSVMGIDGDKFYDFKNDSFDINRINDEFVDMIFSDFAFKNNERFTEIQTKIENASIYSINNGPAFYDAMVKSRNELKGAPGMSDELQQRYDEINVDLRQMLDYPDFNKRMDQNN